MHHILANGHSNSVGLEKSDDVDDVDAIQRCSCFVELSARPDLHDKLIPMHADASELSPDSTGVDQLTEDINDSLNMHDSQSSGLVGKFRSSLKKKISIKGMSGLTKTPVKRRTEGEDGEKEEPVEVEVEETSPGLERSENLEDLEVKLVERSQDEVHEVEETVETVTHTVEETVEVKKKKKKKRRPREEEVGEQEIQVMESTPVKAGAVSGGVELPDFAESPVVTVETEEKSYEVTTEEQHSTSASGKAKKSKRRTPKKKTQQTEDGDEQIF